MTERDGKETRNKTTKNASDEKNTTKHQTPEPKAVFRDQRD
jgi:hypothetical protein